MDFALEEIGKMIYIIREQKVMLDSDLARLYGVETRTLNQAVKRNFRRFPEDFMFRLTEEEYESLRSQIVISKEGKGGRRYQPLVFTENGVAMLSTVLKSEIAIQINISVMRIFTQLRSFHMLEKNVSQQIKELRDDTSKLFKVVFERLDGQPALPEKRRKIGFKE